MNKDFMDVLPYTMCEKDVNTTLELCKKLTNDFGVVFANDSSTVQSSLTEFSATKFRRITKAPRIEKVYKPYSMTVTVFFNKTIKNISIPTNDEVQLYFDESTEECKTEKLNCIGNDKFSLTKGVYIAISKAILGNTYDFDYIEQYANVLPHIKYVNKLVRQSVREYKERILLERKFEKLEQERKEIVKRRRKKNLEKKKKKIMKERAALVDLISDSIKK